MPNTKNKRALLIAATLLFLACLWPALRFHNADPEDQLLYGFTRRRAPGRFARTSLGLVHYQMFGPRAARTVVLIHGFSVPMYLWDPTYKALVNANFRVLRYDLLGRGFSDRPELDYNGELFDRQLTELLDELNISGPVDLVASSMGGPIAATFACRHPERVQSVSFFDPGFSKGQTLPWNLRTRIIGDYNFATAVAPRLAESQLQDFLHPERFPDWPERYRPQMRLAGFRQALLSTLRNYLAEDWTKGFECLGKGTAPVLLVWGRHDKDVPFATSQEVLAAIPRAKFLPVEDAAHVPFLEHPEITNPVLIDFLGGPQPY